jgi:hypothetical protein
MLIAVLQHKLVADWLAVSVGVLDELVLEVSRCRRTSATAINVMTIVTRRRAC